MDIASLRQIMGLTLEQMADEIGISPEMLQKFENSTLPPQLNRAILSAFPINPAYLKNDSEDPFLPSFEQSTPGDRLREWRKEHGVSLKELAEQLDVPTGSLRQMEDNPQKTITRDLACSIERQVGISHRWLMYGDGRTKQVPVVKMAGLSAAGPDRKEKSDPPKNPKTLTARAGEAKMAGLRIRKARMEADLTLKEAGKLLGVSGPRVSQMEHGAVSPELEEEVVQKLTAYTRRSAANGHAAL